MIKGTEHPVYTKIEWQREVGNGRCDVGYENWVKKKRDADKAEKAKQEAIAMQADKLKGRPLSEATKKRIETAIGLGLTLEQTAEIAGCSLAAVKRALHVGMPAFTKEEVDLITAGLSLLLARKNRDFHDSAEFTQTLMKLNSVGPVGIEALHKRISTTGLEVE